MTVLSQARLDLVRAFFCEEFETEILTPFHMRDASSDDIAEFTVALQNSGLLLAGEVDAIALSWKSEPTKLFLLLGSDADNVKSTQSVAATEVPAFRKAS